MNRNGDELLEGLDAIVWEADPVSFQFTYVSRGAERLLGYSLEYWLTRPQFWVDLLHPEDRDHAVAACRSAVENCRDHEFEYRMIAADGRVLWIRDIVRVVCPGPGNATALRGVMLDVSDRKRAASAVVHDFNNVLFAIRGYVSVALEANDVGTMRRDLEEIRKAADIGAALTSQFLAFGERRPPAVETIDVHAALQAHHRLLRSMLGPEIRFVLRFDASMSRVRLPKGQLEQIMINLAVNARHAMPCGGEFHIVTSVDPWGATRAEGLSGEFVIAVTDTGTGIPAEFLGRIFDPYFTTKPPDEGTGLGLSTVYGIVKNAGGSITVQSTVGAGATFTVRLPLV